MMSQTSLFIPPVNGSVHNSLVPENKGVSANDLRHHIATQILKLVRFQDSPGIPVYQGETVLLTKFLLCIASLKCFNIKISDII